MAARDDTDFLVAAAVAAKALQTARDALARAPVPGPKGNPGTRGEPGKPGNPGRDGKDGEDADPADIAAALRSDAAFVESLRGERGPKGEDGRSVDAEQVAALLRQDDEFAEQLKGERGERGEPGLRGPPGDDGKGDRGEPGPRGRDGNDGRDAAVVAPARVTFERDSQRRTARMLVLPLSGGTGFEILPVRDLQSGLMVSADIGIFAPAGA
jgi:hypothetical protein